MKFITKTEIEKLDLFLETEGHRILFYHNDADGICSAALFLKFFQYFDARVRGGPILDDNFVKEMEIEKPNLLVFLDLPIDQHWNKIDKLLKKLPNLRIVLIDHHIFEKNLNSNQKDKKNRVLHINSMFKTNEYIPASAIVYDILKDMKKNVVPFIWISCIGIIGDYGFESKGCVSFLNECKRKYPDLLDTEPKKSNTSKLAEGVEIISSAVAVRGFTGAGRVLEALVQVRDYNDFAKNKTFENWVQLRKREFEKVVKKAEGKKEVIGDVIFYSLKAKLGVYQDVSTHFGEKNPDKVIITIKDIGGGFYKIGLRGQSGKHNLGHIAKKCSKGIGNGGGHVKAAGAVVNDITLFKKRILKEVNKK